LATGVALGSTSGVAADGGAFGPPVADARGGDAVPSRRRGAWLVEIAIVVVVALVFAVVLRTFAVQTFFIPSASMEPTLMVGDRILVNKLSYHFHGVGRGDIVVFQRPANEDCAGAPVSDLVKRVIGLPGNVVSLNTSGQVLINGKVLPEPWLPRGVTTSAGPPGAAYNLTHPYTVPAGDYYVMGDNRSVSCDSRYWGPIPKSLIVGKVDARIWPLSRITFF
jgi:signal peptidase I